VARNRKRAKDRRARRTGDAPVGRRGVAAAAAESAPDPIEHATPDVELVDAQLAVGRPALAPDEDLSAQAEAEEREEELEDGAGGGDGAPPARRRGFGGGGGGQEPGAHAHGHAAEPVRVGLLARLMGFLQGSWRELQRVQWPDRRQVAQATGVVIGFVIVAGVFLGLADLAFSHLMTYILK
jgi:preprotein translocase subunit SecE